jgi:hypothetical protein
MKFLKFLFTARMGFVLLVLLALLAFAITLLYVSWVNIHQTPMKIQQPAPAQTR